MLGTPWNSAQSLRASKTQDLFSPPAVLNTECESCFVVFNSLRLRGLYSPWNSPGQDTGVGSLSLIQGIFPIQGSNLGLPLCRQILYKLSHKGSPGILDWVVYPFSTESSRPRNQACIAGGFFTNWAIREALHDRLEIPKTESMPQSQIDWDALG